MIEVVEAKRLLLEDLGPLEPVLVPLALALGRVLAETVVADRDFPPTDRSAMDGFAVRAADLPEPGGVLRLVGEVRAGRPAGELRVGEREAVRVLTGSVVPPGADAVVMQELAEESSDPRVVRIREKPDPAENIRRQGEELRRGEPVLEAGEVIGAAQVAALAAVGRAAVRVVRAPIVHVLSTGDEVVPLETEPAPHQVRNSNAWALLAQLAELGVEGVPLGIAPDEPDALEDLVARGLEGDLLLLTGGVSVGDYDLVADTLRRLGLRLLFHKVNMRPGKPILAGRAGRSLVLALPGNPVSAFVGFALFGAVAVRRMLGHRRFENLELNAVLAESLRRRPGRPGYALARAELQDGRVVVRPVQTTGSGDVLSLARANALVPTEPSPHALPAGEQVRAILWRDFHLT